jgi:hypothetical protein
LIDLTLFRIDDFIDDFKVFVILSSDLKTLVNTVYDEYSSSYDKLRAQKIEASNGVIFERAHYH